MLPTTRPALTDHDPMSQPHVLMLSAEFLLHRVGGLGAHVSALAPRLAEIVDLDLVVPRYNNAGLFSEQLGSRGRLFRVDAAAPVPASDYDLQVWRMNDQLNAYISTRIGDGESYDILHTHDWLSGYVANDLHRRYDIPLIATFHATEHGRVSGHTQANELSRRIHLAEEHLAREADLIITCSRYMRDEVSHDLGADAQKIIVIPNGVDAAAYEGLRPAQREAPELRQRLQLADGPIIFFVGRLVWEKGPDLLISAMQQVVAHYPSACAVIAGRGPQQEALAGQAKMLGLAEHVHMAGFISDTLRNELYALADVAVFPSRYEPFGIVALEAMATGVPVVVSDVGGLGEVVVDGVTGLSAQGGQVDSLAAAVLQVLADPQEAEVRARRAQGVVREQYSWDRIAQQTLAAYHSVLAGSVDGRP